MPKAQYIRLRLLSWSLWFESQAYRLCFSLLNWCKYFQLNCENNENRKQISKTSLLTLNWLVKKLLIFNYSNLHRFAGFLQHFFISFFAARVHRHHKSHTLLSHTRSRIARKSTGKHFLQHDWMMLGLICLQTVWPDGTIFESPWQQISSWK